MQVSIQAGVVGRNGVSWGTNASGEPVLLIESPRAVVRIDMSAAEAQAHGAQAIFIGYGAMLAAGGNAEARPASMLTRPDGSPLG